MRHFVALTAILVAGCSASVNDDAASAGPDIGVTAAPGMALDMQHRYRAPAARIAAMQEAHAGACERLGLARCRITALRYDRDPDAGVEGTLHMSLAADLAPAFGRAAAEAVERGGGTLLSTRISGVEKDGSGAAEATVARGDVPSDRAPKAVLRLEYRSGPPVTGFDPRSPVARAAELFLSSLRITFGGILAAFAMLSPPGLVALGLFLLWRRWQPSADAMPRSG